MGNVHRLRLFLAALVAVIALVGFGGAVYAAQTPADITVTVSPVGQSVPQGQTATYAVTVTSLHGFAGTVSLARFGGPVGTSLSPSSVRVTSEASGRANLVAPTGAATSLGSSVLMVVAVSGRLQHTATTGLTVTPAPSPLLSVGMAPGALTVTTGTSSSSTITVTRARTVGPVALGVYGALPAGVTATVSPVILLPNATTATLRVTVADRVSPTALTIYVVAAGGGQIAAAPVALTTVERPKTFTITPARPVGALSPGVTQPVDLAMNNPTGKDLSVANLTVTITGTGAPGCSTDNYRVTPFTGRYPLSLPAGATVTLDAVPGLTVVQWPSITMLDLPTNQDACKGAVLSLAFAGSAQGN